MFIDFRKAFDVIPHKTLLKKPYSCGIRGNLYDWSESNVIKTIENISEFKTLLKKWNGSPCICKIVSFAP